MKCAWCTNGQWTNLRSTIGAPRARAAIGGPRRHWIDTAGPRVGLPCSRCPHLRLDPTIPAAPILVVDDDAKIVRLVRTYLERDGFTVVTAADGPAALEAIETHQPALVVLDLMLPELDGRAVIRAVRRDEEAAHTPILVLSARSSTIDRIAGLEDGADDYLPKPFSPAELVLRVKSILRRAAPAGAAPTAATGARRRSGHPPRRPHDRPVAPRSPARRRGRST